MIDKLEKHYIVCGYGRVGRAATRELRAGRRPDRRRGPQSGKGGARHARGPARRCAADSTQDSTLEQAGVRRAKGLIAALATDADNLFLILSAKTLNPELKVAARVGEEEAEQKLRRAGADTVFAPYTNAGHHMALSLVRPHVVQFLDAATRDIGLNLRLEQIRVSEGSRAGLEVAQADAAPPRRRRHRAGHPQSARRDALQSAGRGRDRRRRLS